MSDRYEQKQGPRRKAGNAAFLLALLVLGCALSACGKKPGHLDPPPDMTEEPLTMSYPDPATDPKPEPAQ